MPTPNAAYSVNTIADLKTFTTASDGDGVILLGYYAINDGGGGEFYWNSTSTATDDGGTIIKTTALTTGRWLRILIDNTVSVLGFGAKGDATTNCVTNIQNALNSIATTVVFPSGYPLGSSFLINTGLTVPANKSIVGNGCKIFSTSHLTLLALNSGVSVTNLEIQGAGNSSYDSHGIGISAIGTYTSIINYVSDIILSDCNIHDLGAYGIYLEYCDNVNISNCEVANIGYGGIFGLSVNNVTVNNGTSVDTVSPGTASNAYGMAFTRKGNKTDLTQYPRSSNCIVDGCIVQNNPLWEGLDTHGGQNIQFINNTINNCKVGIAFVSARDDNGNEPYAPQNCIASGNIINGLTTGYGIVVAGNETESSLLTVISNNRLYNCGEETNNISGGIVCKYTDGVSVTGNTLQNCCALGINMYINNGGFSLTGNTIMDVQDSTFTVCSAIGIRSTGNTGVISGNAFLLTNLALNTYVMVFGIIISTATSNSITIGINYSNCTNSFSGVFGAQANFGEFGGTNVKLFGYTANPNGNIVAASGSMCVSVNGGSTKTFYIKESGTGNTGWVSYGLQEGKSIQSGNGIATSFTIAHGLGTTPSYIGVQAGSAAAAQISYTTADATNITVNYSSAPPSGSSNLTFFWSAKI